MTYRNTKTGAVIDSPCTISGGDWVLDEPKKVPEKKVEPTKKKR